LTRISKDFFDKDIVGEVFQYIVRGKNASSDFCRMSSTDPPKLMHIQAWQNKRSTGYERLFLKHKLIKRLGRKSIEPQSYEVDWEGLFIYIIEMVEREQMIAMKVAINDEQSINKTQFSEGRIKLGNEFHNLLETYNQTLERLKDLVIWQPTENRGERKLIIKDDEGWDKEEAESRSQQLKGLMYHVQVKLNPHFDEDTFKHLITNYIKRLPRPNPYSINTLLKNFLGAINYDNFRKSLSLSRV